MRTSCSAILLPSATWIWPWRSENADFQSLLQARPTALAWSEGEKKLGVSLGNATLTVRVEVAPTRDTHVPEAVMPDLPPEGSLRCGARVEYIHEKR